MNFFLKIHVLSILYALLLILPIELLLNAYRIGRLTTWEIGNVNAFIGWTTVVTLIVGTILMFLLAKKWMGKRKAQFWTLILWVPYFVLLIVAFASMFPMINEGDMPNPGTGLLMLGALIVYPTYILLIHLLSYFRESKEGC